MISLYRLRKIITKIIIEIDQVGRMSMPACLERHAEKGESKLLVERWTWMASYAIDAHILKIEKVLLIDP